MRIDLHTYDADSDDRDYYRAARIDRRATRAADKAQDDRPNLEAAYMRACGISR